MWPEGPILSISPLLNNKISIIMFVFFFKSCLLKVFHVTTIFFTLTSAKFSSFANFTKFLCCQFKYFLMARHWLQVPAGLAHSMGLQHSHRSGLRNCCKARRQICFDCQAAALVRDSRPHTAQAESATLLLTSLFQIRAQKAGWLKRRAASA